MLKWLPIETAPRDEHPVLGYDPTVPANGHIAVITWIWDGWSVIHDAEDYAWSDYTPTHWMPLPAPPGKEEA